MTDREPPMVFPTAMPAWVLADHKRAAEVRVFDALREQLDAPWHIFYSRPWIGLDRDGREKEGEADFVLAHPDLGFLVLEVKGGRVGRKPNSEQWISVDGEGFEHRIKDPLRQASECKHRLLRQFKELPGWRGRFVTARHAVVFPSCRRPERDLGPDMPTWLFAGIDEMPKLGQWVEQRLEQHLGDERAEPDQLDYDGVGIMRDHLSRSFMLERPQGDLVAADDEAIRVMTDQQALILDAMQAVARVAIPGPAGTGKTALAIEKARRLAREGKRTLLTCFNRPLAMHIAGEVAGLANLTVRSFHQLCREMAATAGLDVSPNPSVPEREHYRRVLPEALRQAVALKPELRFDAVVIDEGQDFPEEWRHAIDVLLVGGEASPLYVFFDDNQKVFGRQHSIASTLPTTGLRLNRILRNGRTIVEAIQALIPKPFQPAGPSGQPVEWVAVQGGVGASRLERLIAELTGTRSIPARQIALIFADEQSRNAVVKNGRIGNVAVHDAEDQRPTGVVCDSIRRFKGLERQVVVLVDPSRVIGEPETIYVGLTRARSLLVLVDSQAGLDQLRTLLS